MANKQNASTGYFNKEMLDILNKGESKKGSNTKPKKKKVKK